MTDENKKLLDEVIKNRLETALESDAEAEGNNAAFKQAMEAIDRQIEVDKKSQAKRDLWIRIGEIAAGIILVPTIQHCFNMRYAKIMCNFEKDYTFTTSPGRAMSKFFNFKGKN